MIILADISFPNAADYLSYAPEPITYNGKNYANWIKSISDLTESISLEKGYEIPQVTIEIKDPERKYRNILIDTTDQYIANITVILRKVDGSILFTLKVESWSMPEMAIILKCSNKIDMNTLIPTGIINSTTWPNATTNAIGQPVPMALNGVIIKAWKVGSGTTDYTWLLGNKEISSVTNVSIGKYPTLDPGLYSLTSSGGYWYLKLNHGVIIGPANGSPEYCWVTVTTPSHTPKEMADDLLSNAVTVAANTNFSAFMAAQGYTTTKIQYILQRQLSAADLLRIFCTSFECEWRFSANLEIEFVYIDRGSILTSYDFAEGELISIKPQEDYKATLIENQIRYSYNWNNQEGKYTTNNGVFNGGNQSDWGIFPVDLEYEFLNESVQAGVSAEERYNLRKEPAGLWDMSCYIETATNIRAGDIISITDRRLKTPNPVLFQIRRKTINPMTDIPSFTLRDINWLRPTWYWKANQGYVLVNPDKKVIISR